MKAMTETELVVWNAMVKKYQLTPFGLHVIAESQKLLICDRGQLTKCT